jgi:condensin-2 complex subunit D3
LQAAPSSDVSAVVEARVVRVLGALASNIVADPSSAASGTHKAGGVKGDVAWPLAQALDVIIDLYDRLASWRDAPQHGVASAAVRTLAALTAHVMPLVGGGAGSVAVPPWERHLLAAAHEQIRALVFRDTHNDAIDETRVMRALHLVGELVLVTNVPVPDNLVTLLTALMDATLADVTTTTTTTAEISGGDAASGSELSTTAAAAAAAALTLRLATPLRAHAFTALGKICVKHEAQAKRSVRVLIREMETSADPVLRNNALVVVADIARQYTSLVEVHVDALTARLADPHPTVRKHALTHVAQLFAEDFLKFKGTMFFRVVALLVDPDPTIRALVEQFLMEVLLVKAPQAIGHYFVESLFYFNGYHAHPTFCNFPHVEKERPFALVGGDAAGPDVSSATTTTAAAAAAGGWTSPLARRHHLYAHLLGLLPDETKFHIAAKLAQEVLGALVEGVFPLDAASAPVIKDALLVLASPHIKMSTGKRGAAAGAEGDDDEFKDAMDVAREKEAKLLAAKGKILSQMVKKNFLENVVPVLIELKGVLERQHSPLVGALFAYLREFLGDYRKELSDLLADKQLGACGFLPS